MRFPFPSFLRAVDRGDLRDALALAAAIAVVGASFGALAAADGVPPLLIVAMSALVFAGGAQFLVVAVVAAGGSVVAAIAAGFLLNLRLLPFGLAVGETVVMIRPYAAWRHVPWDEGPVPRRRSPPSAKRRGDMGCG